MRPALSVVAFTVLSGAGLGALALLALIDVAHALGWTGGPKAFARAGMLALALVVTGLCASVLHLGNPRNAWRSLARVRTSWLSREAAAALALLPAAAVWIAGVTFDALGPGRPLLAILVVPLAWLTLYCTAMIYASLKPIRAWHSGRVPLAYFALGHASGLLVIVAMLRMQGEDASALSGVAVVLFALAAAVKLDYYLFLAGKQGRLTLEQAIGVPRGVAPDTTERALGQTRMQARLLDVGHSRGTFLTREFGYTLTQDRRSVLRLVVWVGGFAVPIVWLASALTDGVTTAIACGACLAGLLVERWLFFAEARHTVRLYHGDPST